MLSVDGTLLYSAKDLINFLGCAHNTALDLLHISGQVADPESQDDDYLEVLKAKGVEHERRYLETLRGEGRSVREIARVASLDAMAEATRQAMRDGVDLIYQGALVSRPWHGYSDFLLKVDTPSKLGSYSYEVADTKLARSAKPKQVVQLCIYSQLVAGEQELLPEHAHVLLGDGSKVTLRLQDCIHYCDVARERFLAFVSDNNRRTEAEPCSHFDLCRWADRCEAKCQSTDEGVSSL
jgi:uncharacterized protein